MVIKVEVVDMVDMEIKVVIVVMEIKVEEVVLVIKGVEVDKVVKEIKEEVDPAELLSDITMQKMSEIFHTLLKREIDRVDPVRSKFGTITRDEIRLEDRMVEIRNEVKGLRSINFKTLLGRKRGKINIIVSFLAILELMKTGILNIRQEEMFGDIIIDSLE